MNDGIMTRTPNGTALVFTRELAHPAERVWEVLTRPDERAAWFFAGTLELAVGGVVDLTDSAHGITGTVTAVEAGRLLEFTWSSKDAPRSTVRFELEDGIDSCRLTFTHEIDETCNPENLMTGWHSIFEDLPYALADKAASSAQP